MAEQGSEREGHVLQGAGWCAEGRFCTHIGWQPLTTATALAIFPVHFTLLFQSDTVGGEAAPLRRHMLQDARSGTYTTQYQYRCDSAYPAQRRSCYMQGLAKATAQFVGPANKPRAHSVHTVCA